MNFTPENMVIATRLREIITNETATVDDGEAIGLVLFWTFVLDHASNRSMNADTLARAQLEAFIKKMAPHIRLSPRVPRLNG